MITRYIVVGAFEEINITAPVREGILELEKTDDVGGLHLFDESHKEILELLGHVFNQWKHDKQFKTLYYKTVRKHDHTLQKPKRSPSEHFTNMPVEMSNASRD